MSRGKAGGANQGCRQYSNRQTRNNFYQMFANMFCTKYLEKLYDITNSHKMRHERPKKNCCLISQLSVIYKLFTKMPTNRITTMLLFYKLRFS